LAGGDWPGRAREAAVKLSAPTAADPRSLCIKLLGDIRALFEKCGIDRLASAALIGDLTRAGAAPGAGWARCDC
jgi:hypothetical protein